MDACVSRQITVNPNPRIRRPLALLAGALALATGLSAQSPFAHNRLEFSNRLLTDRDDVFPNQATPLGTQAGDALFKIFPATITERHGNHRVSGYRTAIALQRGFQGFLPARVSIPSVQVYRTKVETLGGPILGRKEYDVVDFSTPVTGVFDSIHVDLPGMGAYTVQVEMDPAASDPKLRQLVSIPGLVGANRAAFAVVLRGTPGQSSLSPFQPTAVMRPSYLERHIAPGRDSYSGSYTASTGEIAMYGMMGQPSPRGELYVSLLFDNPTMSMFASSAGGHPSHSAETRMGPGAFDTDAATGRKVTVTGFFAHAEQFDRAGGGYAMIPLIVAMGPRGPVVSQSLGSAILRLDPSTSRLDRLFHLGYWGNLAAYTSGGVVGFARDKRGVWVSRVIPIPPDPAIKGGFAWLQGVVVGGPGALLESTNVVRFSLN